MAVVIRLQGLRITAGSEDIRSFFTGLRIPDGGVHIIGGELEEAFILFASDEDARRAMSRSGGCIKGSTVNLLLSSKTEMQKVLEESARKSEANSISSRRIYKEGAKRPAAEARPPLPLDEEIIFSPFQDMGNSRGSSSSLNDSRSAMGDGEVGLYVQLSGLPFAATKEDVRMFFNGLQVDDLCFLRNCYGMFNGIGLVKFATIEDTREGLKRHLQFIGSRYICIKVSSEDQWVQAGGVVQPDAPNPRKRAANRTRSRSPVRSRSPSDAKEYYVLYENLSSLTEKRDLKELLRPVFLKEDQIFIFRQRKKENIKSAIVVFRDLKDYCSGLAHHNEKFRHRVVDVSPISKEKMETLLGSSAQSRDGRRSSRSSERSQKSIQHSEKRCLYVRNLPFYVRKEEIMDFFHGFQISEDRVILLTDESGAGLGEVLIVFQTEKEALMAQSLNGQWFLGSQVILTCITLEQMQAFDLSSETLQTTFPKNLGRHGDLSPPAHDQMYVGDRDTMPDRSSYGHGSDAAFESFEEPDVYGRGSHRSGPRRHRPSEQRFDGPTRVKLLNLPSKIRTDEIYDFCYGYKVVEGSVSLQYNSKGLSVGSATVVFETHSEAVTAVQELNGRPIGKRKIKIVFV